VSEAVCPHCGADLPIVKDAFCPSCGEDVDEPPRGPQTIEELVKLPPDTSRLRYGLVVIALLMFGVFNLLCVLWLIVSSGR
jgi:hypothetical protein